MDSTAPPESQLKSKIPPPSNPTDDLGLPANVLSEIDALLQESPTPQVEPEDPPPGKRVHYLREAQWTTISLPPWHDMMHLTPVREPVNKRIIIIKEALNLKSFLDSRPRKRNAMLAQAVGVKVTPQCEQCEQGKGQFVGCVVIPDMFEGACANCVWEKSRCQKGQCSFLLEKEHLEEGLKHEEKMRRGGGHTFFGVWKLPKK
ncbi:uncharacterized protein N7473_012810 [Penicillium subrubescens]|uniref:Uncharacterized protein n=1 Tax=Penicillium subrubescens TaxID=1316194 RepID=A0A1Q5T4B2_9EURO|nr:uncharacterized protein N7473_012810 [Penicillium subrubescens]KAJ5875463.1 hypothetical protein N7473_012810 [Penicillium subrubescens]OKO95072.1 hypothetical protein PENSUB_11314 [Penicillium subrubescens]